MRRIALFFVFATTFCHGFAVEGPQNTFSVVGQNAILNCRPANGSKLRKWLFKRSNAEENASVEIYTTLGRQPKKPTCERCIVTTDQNGSSVLSFNATTMGDGGSYICSIDTDGIETPYGAELIVLDGNSQCELKTSEQTTSGFVMEGNHLEISCNFSFAGNMVPVTQWFRNSHRISLPFHKVDNYVDGIHWFHFNATLQLNASDNGMVFGYEVDFKRSNTTESKQSKVIRQANNTLSNVFRWSFTAVVWSMPRNFWIEPVKMIHYFGDRVECSAEGNPSPKFTWSCDVGNVTKEGSVLTLDADIFEANVSYTCQCTAMSSIIGTNVSETEWTFHKMLFIIAAALAPVVLIIAAILGCVCYRSGWKGFLCCAANNDPDVVQRHEDRSKTPAADTSNKSNEIPVYGEVRKPLTGPPGLKTEKRRSEATAKGISCSADKDDAVIYLDLKGGRSKVGKSPTVASPTMTSQTAMFNQSEYASIDHALQPPPLKKRNN